MPNHHCCVPGCTSDQRKVNNPAKYPTLAGVTFWRFPSASHDPRARQHWADLSGRTSGSLSIHTRVCSRHFPDGRPTQNHPHPTLYDQDPCTVTVRKRAATAKSAKTGVNATPAVSSRKHRVRTKKQRLALIDDTAGETAQTAASLRSYQEQCVDLPEVVRGATLRHPYYTDTPAGGTKRSHKRKGSAQTHRDVRATSVDEKPKITGLYKRCKLQPVKQSELSQCGECVRGFTSTNELQVHLTSCHGEPQGDVSEESAGSFFCNACEIGFSDEDAFVHLGNHIIKTEDFSDNLHNLGTTSSEKNSRSKKSQQRTKVLKKAAGCLPGATSDHTLRFRTGQVSPKSSSLQVYRVIGDAGTQNLQLFIDSQLEGNIVTNAQKALCGSQILTGGLGSPCTQAVPNLAGCRVYKIVKRTVNNVSQTSVTDISQPFVTGVNQACVTGNCHTSVSGDSQPSLTKIRQPSITKVSQPSVVKVSQPSVAKVSPASGGHGKVSPASVNSVSQVSVTEVRQPSVTSVSKASVTAVRQVYEDGASQASVTEADQTRVSSADQPSVSTVNQTSVDKVSQACSEIDQAPCKTICSVTKQMQSADECTVTSSEQSGTRKERKTAGPKPLSQKNLNNTDVVIKMTGIKLKEQQLIRKEVPGAKRLTRQNPTTTESVKVEIKDSDVLKQWENDIKYVPPSSSQPVFVCPQCREEFISVQEMRFHIRTHGFVLCVSCGKYCGSLAQLVAHTTSEVHEDLVPCSQCGLGLTTAVEVEKHSVLHQITFSITCDRLSRNVYEFFDFLKTVSTGSFDDLDLTRESEDVETDTQQQMDLGLFPWETSTVEKSVEERGEPSPFPNILKTDDVSSSDHSDTEGKGKKIWVCLICRNVCVGLDAYKDHVSKMHTAGPFDTPSDIIACRICHTYFDSPLARVQHVKQVHGTSDRTKLLDLLPYQCNICSERFVNKTAQKRHLQTHRDDYFPCQLCKDVCSSRPELDNHIMLAHMNQPPKPPKTTKPRKKPVLCEVCGFKAVCQSSLLEHKARHSEERKFACGLCDLRFKTLSRCKSHIKRHTLAGSCQCDQCPKSFTTKTDLEMHLRFHNDVRPYPCPQCGRAFHTKQNMRVHVEKYCKGAPNKKITS